MNIKQMIGAQIVAGIIVGSFLVGRNSLSAEVLAQDAERADFHVKKARILIEDKDWSTAAEEIRQATNLNPNSADAWLIRGTVAMRLEKNIEAKDAYKKYLALNPPADKAKFVEHRLIEIEVRLDKDKRTQEQNAQAARDAEEAVARAKAERYGPKGAGFFFGYSPIYQPKISTAGDLNSSVSSSFDLGFRIALIDIGFRYASGTVPSITTLSTKDVSGGPYLAGTNTVWDFYVTPYIPINDIELEKPGFQFLVPIRFNMYMNNVTFDKVYWNMGLGGATGIQVRYYTASMVAFDVMGTYCLSYPINSIQNNNATIINAINSEGNKISGKLDGMDLRIGAVIFF